MTKKKFFYFLLVLFFLLPLAVFLSWPDEKLYFTACNVGQGDAILLSKGFTQILIDGGPNDMVLDCLEENVPFWDRTIELVINTHPDKDHLKGLVEVIRRYQVKQVLVSGFMADTQVFKEFEKEILKHDISVYSPKKGERIKIDELEFKVLWPEEKVLGADVSHISRGNANQNSLVFWLKYGDFDALLMGDVTEREEKKIARDNEFKDIEVLKVAHHGSKYSSPEEFLKAVRPDIAVISVGKNPWGHPTDEVLERLESIGSEVLRTDEAEINLKI